MSSSFNIIRQLSKFSFFRFPTNTDLVLELISYHHFYTYIKCTIDLCTIHHNTITRLTTWRHHEFFVKFRFSLFFRFWFSLLNCPKYSIWTILHNCQNAIVFKTEEESAINREKVHKFVELSKKIIFIFNHSPKGCFRMTSIQRTL